MLYYLKIYFIDIMTKIILNEDLPLQVGFREKEAVKKMGAKPYFENSKFKYWFVPQGNDVSKFIEFWNQDFKTNFLKEHPEIESNAIEHTGIRLSNALALVKQTIESQLAKAMWITAEVVHCTGTTHVYLELADYDENGNELAKARAAIFANNKSVLTYFVEQTGLQLQEGMKILFKAFVSFHEKYGLSFEIKEIDSKYTMGDMEAKIVNIRKELKKQGIYDLNKSMTLPFDFFNIAVIAPNNAAGLGDFRTQADELKKQGLCNFNYFSAVFQGKDVVPSITNALHSIKKEIEQGEVYDAVVIIRGGGDKAGLYALNEIEIAKSICLFPIPVIIGIGHERDVTLLDEVGNLRLPTPSMVASHISGTIIKNAQKMKQNCLLLKKLAQGLIDKAKLELEGCAFLIKTESQNIISILSNQIDVKRNSLLNVSNRLVDDANHQVNERMTQIMYLDPKRIIDRGYGIVRNEKNKRVISDVKNIEKEDTVVINLRDGSFDAVVTKIETKQLK